MSAPTETAFSLEKKSAGEISKMQRLFLVGRSGQTCLLGGGLGSALRAKMGSSVGVKLYQYLVSKLSIMLSFCFAILVYSYLALASVKGYNKGWYGGQSLSYLGVASIGSISS